MQNAGHHSRPIRTALAGLALTTLVAANPAAAGEETASAGAFAPAARPGNARPATALPDLRPRLRPAAIALGRSGSILGLAYRMTEGLSLGAGGGIDPGSGALLAIVALDIRF